MIYSNVLKLRKLERQKASPSGSKGDALKDKPQKNVLPILQNTTSSAKEAPRAYQHGQRLNSGSSAPSGSRLPDRNSKSRNRRAWRNVSAIEDAYGEIAVYVYLSLEIPHLPDGPRF